jgi:hypothetical protein
LQKTFPFIFLNILKLKRGEKSPLFNFNLMIMQ